MSKIKENQGKYTPTFNTEAEEKAFWENNDSSEYVNWKQAKQVSMPNLKPSTKTISLRLPEGLLDSIKVEANKRDMPYQSLIKVWLSEEVKQSHQSH
jgi:predicted DNA binding CopG/RHH family protein